MAILALYGSGRILLHLFAMVGDGCFRFHAGGIMRELSGFATAATLLTRMLARFVSGLVPYLAKPIKPSVSAAPAARALPERDSR
jgi:hypothetical protein